MRGGREWMRGAGLVVAILAIVALVGAGCRSVPGGKEETPGVDVERWTGLLDAETALAVVEVVPGPPLSEGEEVAQREEAFGVLTAAALGFMGLDFSAEEGKDVDPAASALSGAISQVARLLAERRLFTGPIFYGAMAAPPLEGMDWPSAADVLVARTTPAGEEALAELCDALARRFPERVRVLGEPAAAGGREWVLDVPSWRGTARIRLAGGEFRAAFGGGSLAGEEERLVAGTPPAQPLGAVLPAPLEPGTPGHRYWLRPAVLAGYAGSWMDDVFRMAADEGKGQPQEMVLRSLGKQLSPWIERVIASFAAFRGRFEGARGWQEYRLAEDADPVVRLCHDAEGSIAPGLLGGVPADVPVQALALPPLDRLATAIAEALSPDAAGLVKMFLAAPIEGAGGPTWKDVLAALGPGFVAWDEEGRESRGFALEVRDEEAVAAMIRIAARATGGEPPREPDGVLAWREPGKVILVGHGLLVGGTDEAALRRVLSRKGGLGEWPAFRAALERLAEGRPVHVVTWTPTGGDLPFAPAEGAEGEEGLQAFFERLVNALAVCLAPEDELPPGTAGVLGVGTPVPGGGRAVSIPLAADGEGPR